MEIIINIITTFIKKNIINEQAYRQRKIGQCKRRFNEEPFNLVLSTPTFDSSFKLMEREINSFEEEILVIFL